MTEDIDALIRQIVNLCSDLRHARLWASYFEATRARNAIPAAEREWVAELDALRHRCLLKLETQPHATDKWGPPMEVK